MKTAVDDAFTGRQALEEERWTFKLEEIRGALQEGLHLMGEVVLGLLVLTSPWLVALAILSIRGW